ncbi:unnamed protein product [Linum tenue]|uniref:Uncharacterized protein n=1 Tax=Linum tenue TaxID=586396 RepID=A0AAV0NFN3_9ROSI|nr:unnamed protein product [Linum tenue]
MKFPGLGSRLFLELGWIADLDPPIQMNPSIGASRFKASFQNYQWEEVVPANRACGDCQGRRRSRGLREQPILVARRGIVRDAWSSDDDEFYYFFWHRFGSQNPELYLLGRAPVAAPMGKYGKKKMLYFEFFCFGIGMISFGVFC